MAQAPERRVWSMSHCRSEYNAHCTVTVRLRYADLHSPPLYKLPSRPAPRCQAVPGFSWGHVLFTCKRQKSSVTDLWPG